MFSNLSLYLLLVLSFHSFCLCVLPNARPDPSSRKFVSPVIDNYINSLLPKFANADLGTLFSNTFPNTLDTTVYYFSNSGRFPDSFVITGDITAQWLRDSSNQLFPYLDFIQQDSQLQALVCGLIRRQMHDILTDPYANAFNIDDSGAGHQDDARKPAMTKHVFEGKYELDSLAAALKLANSFYEKTNHSNSCFFSDALFLNALEAILTTVQGLQYTTVLQAASQPYTFQRTTEQATDTLMQGGMGVNGKQCGLSRSFFRPSDDATTLPYHVPSNAMMLVELRRIENFLRDEENYFDYTALNDRSALPSTPYVSNTTYSNAAVRTIVTRIDALANGMDLGLAKYGIVPAFSSPNTLIYTYEVDGYGNSYFMDDGNIPSLLSLPYLGYIDVNDPIYVNTRRALLSENQPFFYSGTAAEGIGSPHTGPGYIWPMSIIMRAMTSTSDSEISTCLSQLLASSAGTGFLHESFWLNDPTNFSRPWFAWVNGLFGELIIKLANERPYLIFSDEVAVRSS